MGGSFGFLFQQATSDAGIHLVEMRITGRITNHLFNRDAVGLACFLNPLNLLVVQNVL
jgi:hypothetical protein